MTPEPDYVVWGTTSQGGYAVLLPIDHVEDDYELKEGVSRAEGWPDDASFEMNPSYPRDIQLADAIHSRGGDGVPVVSPALRALIEAAAPPDMEFLPVTIYDHKGHVASADYVIANSFHVVDCLDHDAMGITWNAMDPMSIQVCERVVIDRAKLPDAPAIFRARNLTKRVMVRRDLAEQMTAAGLSGLYFWEPDRVTT